MSHKLSRRGLLKTVGTAGAGLLLPSGLATAATPPILPLSSTSGVYTPPRGNSFPKFSFDFPEPSIEFAGLQFSFRLYTFENVYGLDIERMTVASQGDGIEIQCPQLTWGGGQMKAPGRLDARVRRAGGFIECSASAEMSQPIKSIAAVVRGVPRGKISAGGGAFRDPHDDEILLGYPFGGGSLFMAEGMNTPLAVIQTDSNDFYFLSALHEAVRAHRFYFQPGEKGYRAELTYEEGAWKKSNKIQSPVWRLGKTESAEQAYRLHFQHVERAFGLQDWESRDDIPRWFRDIALVVTLNGMHWTGYVFNDFAKMQRILQWVASQIPGDRVLVFLPAWDGRYYWNYPVYQAEPRLGGEKGFARLIELGKKLGFHLMPMFGTNAANKLLPQYPKFADAAMNQIDGDPLYLNWVDWDNDRHNEGNMPYMNIGVASWREWLASRINEVIARYKVDAYFLDIAGGWENNTQADPHEGTRQLVESLRRAHPDVLCCGEMHYDALTAFIPLYQAISEFAYPAALKKYARVFEHLSHPAPGRGSSGVHESGFGRFDPQTLGLNELQIPTITVVDDTFDRYRNVMAQIIARAKERAQIS